MLTVHLHNLQFYSHHGLYEQEKKTGAFFEVNLDLRHYTCAEEINTVEQTTNYAAVYTLVKKHMQQPTPLLETIAQQICKAILEEFLLVQEVHITLYKLNAPIQQFNGKVGVSYTLKRS